MNREFWLDGFNFFHHWESTRGFLRADSGLDIVRAIDRSLRTLGKKLGRGCGYTVVYLDGGLSRHETRLASLRVRYAGPGRKADDRMTEDLAELGGQSRMVTAVTNDRELRGRLRVHGAACLGAGEYLASLEGKKKSGNTQGKNASGKRPGGGPFRPGEAAEVMREKCRSLSDMEVEAWLEYFGGEDGTENPDSAGG